MSGCIKHYHIKGRLIINITFINYYKYHRIYHLTLYLLFLWGVLILFDSLETQDHDTVFSLMWLFVYFWHFKVSEKQHLSPWLPSLHLCLLSAGPSTQSVQTIIRYGNRQFSDVIFLEIHMVYRIKFRLYWWQKNSCNCHQVWLHCLQIYLTW